MSGRAAAALARQPGVAYVEQDQVITLNKKPSNPGHGGGGGDTAEPPQETPWGISRVGGPSDGTGPTAWVIDTGIDFKHPDLNADASRSVTFVTRGKPTAADGHGHGTHVARTIGAIDNDIDIDVVGVAAAAGGGRFALAAGNEADDANNHSPASANGANIYTVSAIGQDDCLASFSNYGNPPVDTAAPGVGVLSTKKGGGTTTFSGTSMATPHVTGLLLLGALGSDGSVMCGDTDGNPDPSAHL